jgi:hypothetical protein
MNKLSFALALALGSSVFVARPAYAGLDACGDIHVEANAKCVVDVSGGCEARCTPVNLRAQCSVELQAECTGMCTADAQASCTGSCNIDACEARCEVEPAKFDCAADCQVEGSAMCAGECQAAANQAECKASCEASFSARCDSHCNVTPGSADCTAKCEAACEGKCEAQASVDCDISCTSDGYAECEADIQGGCVAHCEEPEGALFCDGQYVDHGPVSTWVANLQGRAEVQWPSKNSAANFSCQRRQLRSGGLIPPNL